MGHRVTPGAHVSSHIARHGTHTPTHAERSVRTPGLLLSEVESAARCEEEGEGDGHVVAAGKCCRSPGHHRLASLPLSRSRLRGLPSTALKRVSLPPPVRLSFPHAHAHAHTSLITCYGLLFLSVSVQRNKIEEVDLMRWAGGRGECVLACGRTSPPASPLLGTISPPCSSSLCFFLSVAVNVGPHDASHRTVVFRVRYLLFMWGGQSSLHSLPSATVAGTLGVRGED